MSQISPPIRILLVAVIGLVAAYMLFFRPSEPAVAPAPATPAAGATPVPAKDPGAATASKPGAIVQGAVAGADNASARADAAAGGAVAETEGGTAVVPATGAGGGVNTNPTTQVPATGTATQPAAIDAKSLARLPKDVRGAVRARKTLVLLFYNNRSYDDRAVRRALDKVGRRGGQIFVDAHWIKSVGRYQAITRGADVQQSPTVVIADSNLKAETLVGYVDGATINQAALDALRAGGGSLVSDPYLRQMDAVCISTAQQLKALSQPATAAALPTYLDARRTISVSADAQFAAVKAPSKWTRFDKRFLAANAEGTAILTKAAADAKANPAKSQAILRSAQVKSKRLQSRFVARNGTHRLTCF